MDVSELMARVIADGGDREGILDRFGDNWELYEICFMEFLAEPNFAMLDAAMAARDFTAAFNSAHALKGISGNLGLESFYKAVCVLVESLRAKRYAGTAEEYAELRRQYDRLKSLHGAPS